LREKPISFLDDDPIDRKSAVDVDDVGSCSVGSNCQTTLARPDFVGEFPHLLDYNILL
jgi:hypothetical protein